MALDHAAPPKGAHLTDTYGHAARHLELIPPLGGEREVLDTARDGEGLHLLQLRRGDGAMADTETPLRQCGAQEDARIINPRYGRRAWIIV